MRFHPKIPFRLTLHLFLLMLPVVLYSGMWLFARTNQIAIAEQKSRLHDAVLIGNTLLDQLYPLWTEQYMVGRSLAEGGAFSAVETTLSAYFFVDAQGRVAYSTREFLVGRDLSGAELFSGLKEDGQRVVFPLPEIGGTKGLFLGRVIFQGDDFYGMVVSPLFLEELLRFSSCSHGRFWVIDGQGRPLFPSFGRISDFEPLEFYQVVWQVGVLDWSIAVRDCKGTLSLDLLGRLKWDLLLLQVLMVALLSHAFFMGLGFAERIAAIGEAARSLAAGNLTTRVWDEGEDEVSFLGENFNNMALRLQVSLYRERFLGEISIYALEGISFSILLHRVVRMVQKEVGARSLSLLVKDEGKERVLAKAGLQPEGVPQYVVDSTLVGDSTSIFMRFCFLRGESLTEADHLFVTSVLQLLRLIQDQRQKEQEIKDSALRFRQLIDGLGDIGILQLDPKGRIVCFSKGAELLTGYSEEDFRGVPMASLGLTKDSWEEQVEKAEENGTFHYTGYLASRKAYINGQLTPLKDSEGEPVGYITLLRDYTRSSRFLHVASHELRNPLTTIKGLIALLRYQVEDDKQSESLLLMDQQLHRFQFMLEDVFEALRLQTGQLRLEKRAFSLKSLFEEVLPPLAMAYPSHALILTPCHEHKGVCTISADYGRLEQVLTNILLNAIKYSETDTSIWIATTCSDRSVTISVKDQGIGICPSEIGRIFECFYRADTLRRTVKGMGLGLFECRTIIERHNGRIWAESRLNEGTTFFVELPRV